MADKTQITDINKRIKNTKRDINKLRLENDVSNERKKTDPLRNSLFEYFDELEERRASTNVDGSTPFDNSAFYSIQTTANNTNLLNIKTNNNKSVQLAKNFKTLMEKQQIEYKKRPSFRSFIHLVEKNQKESRQNKRTNKT